MEWLGIISNTDKLSTDKNVFAVGRVIKDTAFQIELAARRRNESDVIKQIAKMEEEFKTYKDIIIRGEET
jgi:hypothetical protein